MSLLLSGGNGNNDRYLIVAQELDRNFYLARRPLPAEPGEVVEVAVGGLPAYYPLVLVHPLPAALRAAEHYFRTGRRARKLSWMRDDVAERLRYRAKGAWLREGDSDQGGPAQGRDGP